MKYPIIVSVAMSGSVYVETPDRQVGMNRWSERAQRIAATLTPGEHMLHDSAELRDTECESDIRACLN